VQRRFRIAQRNGARQPPLDFRESVDVNLGRTPGVLLSDKNLEFRPTRGRGRGRVSLIQPPSHLLRSAVHAALRDKRRTRWPQLIVAASLAGLTACGSGGGSSDGGSDPPPPAATCGNGAIDATEACDDGNEVAGDGCAATCVVEAAWSCGAVLPPGPSACTLAAPLFAASVDLTYVMFERRGDFEPLFDVQSLEP